MIFFTRFPWARLFQSFLFSIEAQQSLVVDASASAS